jgi:membrane fusion protein (multidrug efflux system)
MADDARGATAQDRGHLDALRRPLEEPEHVASHDDEASWRDAIRNRPWLLPAAIGIALAISGCVAWWLYARQYESTDDAFINARSVAVSPQVSGSIIAVLVTDNQLVEGGTPLLRVDDRDYLAGLAQARAQVDQAKANMANMDAQVDEQMARVDQAHKQVAEAEAAYVFAREENQRAQELLQKAVVSPQQAQQKESNFRQSEAALAAARASAIAAEKQIAVLRTQRDGASAQLDQARATQIQAENNLVRTQVTAPTTGYVTKLSAAKGAYAQVGQILMMFVPREVWVTANYKEVQLANMRPGQPVVIRIDAYPGFSFAGRVDSIQAGSGAAFSLLPPENATGNYVKVVQRVPVKIVFDAAPSVYVGPGMSVVPTVTVR